MRRFLGFLVTCVLCVSCGSSGGFASIPTDELPADIYERQVGPTEPSRRVTVTVFFVQSATQEEDLRLEGARRSAVTSRPTAEFAMEQLLAGPSAKEAGLITAIPDGTRLVRLAIKNEVASLNFAGQFEFPGEDFVHQIRIAQVVWTLTSLAEIKRVRFLIHGVPQPVIDQDGISREVVGRGSFRKFAPVGEGAGLET